MPEFEPISAKNSEDGEPPDAVAMTTLALEVEALEREIRELRARNALLHLQATRQSVHVEQDQQAVPAVEPQPKDPLPWLDRPPRPTRRWERYVSYKPPAVGATVEDVSARSDEWPPRPKV